MATAVVTGGTRGIGAVIAQGLAEQAHAVAVVGRTADRYRADVSDPGSLDRVRAMIERELGPPSILVNAAGVFGPLAAIGESDPTAWIRTIEVNLVGAYLTCRAFLPGMVDAGWGRIINISSSAPLKPPGPLNSAYGTSKAALNQFTRQLAAEVEGTGVTANALHPGDVKSDMWAEIKRQVDELGPVAEQHRAWVDWVGQTGGDDPRAASKAVLRAIDSDVNGRFLWIDDPLQTPLASWD